MLFILFFIIIIYSEFVNKWKWKELLREQEIHKHNLNAKKFRARHLESGETDLLPHIRGITPCGGTDSVGNKKSNNHIYFHVYSVQRKWEYIGQFPHKAY